MRYKVILNPTAGKGKALILRPQIERLLDTANLDFDIYETKGVMDAADAAGTALSEGFDVVVAAGGDGTCNEVLNGLMRSKDRGEAVPDFGALPVGRGNDFCYGAGVPTDLEPAVETLAHGPTRQLDVGKITGGNFPDGRYFGNGIGIGFDTIVGLEAARMTRIHGFASYVVGALKTFIRFPDAVSVILSVDGEKTECATHQISILNGSRMGGTFFMAPDGLTDDGLLDLCMINRPLNRREMLGMILRYTKGSQGESPLIRMQRIRTCLIEAPAGGLICHADGETVSTDGHRIAIELVPDALRIVGAHSAASEA